MAEKGWLDEEIAAWGTDLEFVFEGVLLDVNERVCQLMERKSVSRAELARRLGKSRAYVTRLLNGLPNVTLKTLTQIAIALGEGIEVFVPSSIAEERRRAAEAVAAEEREKRVAVEKVEWRMTSEQVAATPAYMRSTDSARTILLAS